MKLTIREVARTAGVSVATASMALNHRDGVSEKTREKVERVARELNYIPDFSARSLVMQDSKCIGLMIPEIQNPFYSAIVDIMSRIAEKKGYTLLLGISGSKPVQEERNLKMFLSRRVLGIVIVPMLMDKPDVSYLRLVRGTNVPLVFCTERYADTDEPAVMCDFEKGEYDITNFLLNKGLRDLCFVTVDVDTQFANLRMKGFVRALEEAGIAPREGRILRLKEARYDDAYEAADRIYADLPEAIVCINDIMTIGLIKKLSERGVRVPRDLSVVGFDDVQVSALVTPQLTTVHQPMTEICEKTFDLLDEKIGAGDAQEAVGRGETHYIAPRLVIRESTI